VKTDTVRTAYKAAIDAKQAVKTATDAQASALESLKDTVKKWRALPAELAEERTELAGHEFAERETRARLTKPLDEYDTKRQSWQEIRSHCAPQYQNKNAEAVRLAILAQELNAGRIAEMESSLAAGYAAFVKPYVEAMRESITDMRIATANFWQSSMTLAAALDMFEPYSGKELQEAYEAYAKANPTAKEKKTDARTEAAEKIHDLPARALQDGSYVIMADNLVEVLKPFERATDFVLFLGTEIVCKVETLRDLFKLFEGQVTLTFGKRELIARNQNSKTTLKAVEFDNHGLFARLTLAY
jgi:hypothetical protein